MTADTLLAAPPAVQRRCAIYLRISLDVTGEMLAIERQREDCRRIAEVRRWQVVAEYVDNSVSASDKAKDRPGYNALWSAYLAGGFDALVCWDLDRLTRQPRQLEDWIDAAVERGLAVVTANGEADLSTDGGITYAGIKLQIARGEVMRMAARRKRSNRQRADAGKPPLGVRLTGYTTAGDLLEDEAEVVRGMFARFLAGESLRSLTAWLTATGAASRRGGAWNPSSVRTILTNPRYAGRAIYHGKVTGKAGTWPALVDDATFDAVQVKLADPRRRSHVGTDRKHLGSGLYRCGMCGDPVTSWTGDRYRCRVGCLTRSQAPVDLFVVEAVRARLARPDLADLIPAEQDEDTRRVTGELAALRSRLARVEVDYDDELIDGRRYAVARDKILTRLRSAEAALARLGSARAAAGVLHAGDPVAHFDAASLMARRTVIDALCTVDLLPAPRGRKGFDSASVRLTWRT